MSEPKFKIGDFVVPKGCVEAQRLFAEEDCRWPGTAEKLIAQVVEIRTQECYGGKQTHYLLRSCGARGFSKEYAVFAEIELTAAPTEPEKAS